MTSAPVSIVIPVYNAEPFVRQAVESALKEPETGEVILVEDGSDDGSYEICRELGAVDSRVRLLRHESGRNRGPGASRNVGIRAARNELVGFLDADDFFLPGRFGHALGILESHPEADGVYEAVGTYCEDEEAKARCRERGTWDLTTITARVAPAALFDAMFREGKGGLHCDGVLVRQRVFDTVGWFDERLPLAQDTAMWIRMSLQATLLPGRLEQAVAVRRVHSANRSGTADDRQRQYHYLLWKRALDWAYRSGVDRRRLDTILRNYFSHADRWLFGKMRWRHRKLRCLFHTVLVASRHPQLAGSVFLRDYAARCVRCCVIGDAADRESD